MAVVHLVISWFTTQVIAYLASGMNSSVFLGTNPYDSLCHDPPRVWMAAGLPYPIWRPL